MQKPEHPYRLIRYIAGGAVEGVAAGWAILLVVLQANLMGLDDLIDGSADGPLALLMLLWFFGATFGMVGVAWRIVVLLPDQDD